MTVGQVTHPQALSCAPVNACEIGRAGSVCERCSDEDRVEVELCEGLAGSGLHDCLHVCVDEGHIHDTRMTEKPRYAYVSTGYMPVAASWRQRSHADAGATGKLDRRKEPLASV